VLGQGTYSIVRKGERRSDGLNVAIKIVNREGMSEEDQKALLREVEILKIFNHPNIVKLLDFYEDKDYYFLVLEYIAGRKLSFFLILSINTKTVTFHFFLLFLLIRW
jgi:serine/threonine protein kinase